MNLIVWGAGQGYIKYKHLINNITYKLIDISEDKQGTFVDGVKVERPEILYDCEYDYVAVSTSLYFDEVYNTLICQYSISEEKIIRLSDIEKEMLFRDIGKYDLQQVNGPKIMFGYCFLIYENCRIHDYLLAESLRLRGAEIIPVSCGGVQELQCSVYGGMWGNSTHDLKEKCVNHKHNCLKCQRYDVRVWKDWGGYDIIWAKDFLTVDQKKDAEVYIQGLDVNRIRDWKYMFFPIGEWALKTYFNIELISHKNSWGKTEENEIRALAYNVMLMCIASLKIVESISPDIIYSNDSFYYPYSILELIAKHKDIPFYNAYGIRKDTYSYAMNKPVINMDLDSAWKTFSRRKLTLEENEFMDLYITNRRYGKDMMINTADPYKSAKIVKNESVYGSLDKQKKTALIATNVTWDAAALEKGIVFENIIDWVLYTVRFFSKRKDWQLIVRAHPAEVNKLVPEAQERVCSIVLAKYNYCLPSNIILIDGDAPVSIYDLLGQVDLGLVYTTTVGLEMCCYGIPTITVAKAPYRGKGFTYDPITVSEYEEQLQALMTTEIPDNELKTIAQQAKKYFLLYYFIYMLPNPFYKFTYEEGAKLIIRSAEELLPGKNPIWDYICDSIMQKKAILSEDKFPPYILEV